MYRAALLAPRSKKCHLSEQHIDTNWYNDFAISYMIERSLTQGSPIEPSALITPDNLPPFDFDQWALAGFPLTVEGPEVTDEGKQKATQFFEAYLQGDWRSRDLNSRIVAGEENARLKWMLPDVYETFLSRHGLQAEIEEWKRDQAFWEGVEEPETIADWRAGKMFRNRFLDQPPDRK